MRFRTRLPAVLRTLAFAAALLPLSATAGSAASDIVNGVLHYRGFTADMSLVASAPNLDAIEVSLKKQIDIVADCGVKPPIMAFFRSQHMKMKFGGEDGGGRFSSAGVEIDAKPQPPQKPIVLHEMMHAMHNRYIPGGTKNANILKFYGNAKRGQVYPANEYVLKNPSEFFAVTASLYLWGFVARPPNNRETLRAKQPVYYAWLGELFGVKK
jgi:hypothetical protein